MLINKYDVKKALKFLGIRHSNNIWDIGVAAYLLNPLKDSYSPDDIARDFLGKNIPAYSEKFGKEKPETLVKGHNEEYPEYLASICNLLPYAMENVVDKLKEWNMYKLYTEIEMPLVFTLKGIWR